MTTISTKSQMYRLLQAGLLGNIHRTWFTCREMLQEYDGPFGVRHRWKTMSPIRFYYVEPEELNTVLQTIQQQGYNIETDLMFCEVIQSEECTIQGELQRQPGGLYFRYTFSQYPMRVAFEHQTLHSLGLQTHMLLRKHCAPETITELEWLLDKYPDHTVEFSAYPYPVGIDHKPHVIWEVRNY